LAVMSIAYWAFMGCPVFGAVIGYLAEGATGATSGFLIPAGPVLVAWLFEVR
jgi:hypothetical protein